MSLTFPYSEVYIFANGQFEKFHWKTIIHFANQSYIKLFDLNRMDLMNDRKEKLLLLGFPLNY